MKIWVVAVEYCYAHPKSCSTLYCKNDFRKDSSCWCIL